MVRVVTAAGDLKSPAVSRGRARRSRVAGGSWSRWTSRCWYGLACVRCVSLPLLAGCALVVLVGSLSYLFTVVGLSPGGLGSETGGGEGVAGLWTQYNNLHRRTPSGPAAHSSGEARVHDALRPHLGADYPGSDDPCAGGGWTKRFVRYEPSPWEQEWKARVDRWGSREPPGALCAQLGVHGEMERIRSMVSSVAQLNGRLKDAFVRPECANQPGVSCMDLDRHTEWSAAPAYTLISESEGDQPEGWPLFSQLVFRWERPASCAPGPARVPVDGAPSGGGAGDPMAERVRTAAAGTSELSQEGTRLPLEFDVSEPVEPLIGLLRDPTSICENTVPESVPSFEKLFSKDHLLPGPGAANAVAVVGTARPSVSSLPWRRASRSFLFDVGAGQYANGPGGPGGSSTKWLVDSYGHRQFVLFDHIVSWEAEEQLPADVFDGPPAELLPKYAYFNVPASAEHGHRHNPLDVLARVARPSDFVVFKLDVDLPELELALVNQLLNNATLLALIDEFYWEHHVNTPEMWIWWQSQTFTDYLTDTYRILTQLRKHGIRAHSWP